MTAVCKGNIELIIRSQEEGMVRIEARRRRGRLGRWLGLEDKVLFSRSLSVSAAEYLANCITNTAELAQRPDIKEHHRHSFANLLAVQGDGKVGCFNCLEILEPSQIKDWIRERDGGETAKCPYCGIDSLLSSTDVPFLDDPTILPLMKKIYFS